MRTFQNGQRTIWILYSVVDYVQVHPHCVVCTHIVLCAPTLCCVHLYRAVCTHIVLCAPTLCCVHPYCAVCTHIVQCAPTFYFVYLVSILCGPISYFVRVHKTNIFKLNNIDMHIFAMGFESFGCCSLKALCIVHILQRTI